MNKKVRLYTLTFLVVFGIYSSLSLNNTYATTNNESQATITLTNEEKLLHVKEHEQKIVITDLGLT
jgi:hypothetical protein